MDVSATFSIDELLHQRLERLAVLVERRDRPLPAALPGTDVRLLVGDEVRRREESVLEIVDPEIRGFRVGDGAEMAGDLQPALVRLFDRRAELRAA